MQNLYDCHYCAVLAASCLGQRVRQTNKGQSKQTQPTKTKNQQTKQFETNKNKLINRWKIIPYFNLKSVYVSKTRSSGEPFTAKVLQESLQVLIQAPMITKIRAPSNDMVLFTELPS